MYVVLLYIYSFTSDFFSFLQTVNHQKVNQMMGEQHRSDKLHSASVTTCTEYSTASTYHIMSVSHSAVIFL